MEWSSLREGESSASASKKKKKKKEKKEKKKQHVAFSPSSESGEGLCPAPSAASPVSAPSPSEDNSVGAHFESPIVETVVEEDDWVSPDTQKVEQMNEVKASPGTSYSPSVSPDDSSPVLCQCCGPGDRAASCGCSSSPSPMAFTPCSDGTAASAAAVESSLDPSSGATLAEKLLHCQRLGCQQDVSVEQLYQHADGVPVWESVTEPSPPAESPESASSPACNHAPDSTSSDAAPRSLTELMFAPSDTVLVMNHLTRDQLRRMWHVRLGHMHHRRVHNAHRHSLGVPPIPMASELDKCPVCEHAKSHKAARGTKDSRRATRCNQGLSVDCGFIVQKSNTDSERVRHLKGLNGETCCCLIVDHCSGMLCGECFRSKAPPADFLNRWLAKHGLPHDAPDKHVRFDLGGELGRSTEVVELFERAGYTVEPTAPDSSHQNGPGERPHRTIADAARTMLAGARLPPKFWPCAFHHFLRLCNVTAHGDRDASPFELCTGSKPNLCLLRVWGCRVYALPARPRRPDKILSDARVGMFLGYSQTMKNVLHFDTDTKTVKMAQHVAFDETLAGIPNKTLVISTLTELQVQQKRIFDVFDSKLT